jgi:hypothetical protein
MKDAKEIDAIESFLQIAFEIVSPEVSVQYGHVASTPGFHAINLAPQSPAAKGFTGQFRTRTAFSCRPQLNYLIRKGKNEAGAPFALSSRSAATE